ncbi:hypothetical protein FOMPIDRAFT_1056853 [Fomitopsis schrenkii]|uniref:Uncharacterized protein n=1 Tax=Fomitopsis schrenkii TaxID=2126942 RepID=S8DFW1_FOMSC|nr:hypothetical protein FOMPIDRAFT_1056853 [Fomitopsis schrenkii]
MAPSYAPKGLRNRARKLTCDAVTDAFASSRLPRCVLDPPTVPTPHVGAQKETPGGDEPSTYVATVDRPDGAVGVVWTPRASAQSRDNSARVPQV